MWPDLSPVGLVATDLDGTLLDPLGVVTPRTVAAVAAARRAGIHVIPVTGRPPQAMWHLAEQAGVGPLGVCSNGAAIVDVEDRTIVECRQLAVDDALPIVDRARAAVEGLIMAVDEVDRLWYEPGFLDPLDWSDEEMVETPDIRAALDRGCVKLIARRDGFTAAELLALLGPSLSPVADVTSSGPDWVEIGVAGVTKATGVMRICELMGIHPDAVVAVGDNHNDLSLLSWAALAMAPANAIPEVVAVAHHLIPANTEHGVATLLEALVGGLE